MEHITSAARRGIELALDDAYERLNQALADENDEDTWVTCLAEVTKLQQMLEAMP